MARSRGDRPPLWRTDSWDRQPSIRLLILIFNQSSGSRPKELSATWQTSRKQNDERSQSSGDVRTFASRIHGAVHVDLPRSVNPYSSRPGSCKKSVPAPASPGGTTGTSGKTPDFLLFKLAEGAGGTLKVLRGGQRRSDVRCRKLPRLSLFRAGF